MTRPSAMLGLVLVIGAGWNAPGFASSIEILEYGICPAQIGTPATGPGKTPKQEELTSICHVMTTSIVPTTDNMRSGFRYRVRTAVEGDSVDIRKLTTWPDHLKSRLSPGTSAVHDQVTRLRAGEITWARWRIIRSRPGIWTFQLFETDRKLAEMVFTLLAEDEVKVRPDAASTCFPVSNRKEGAKWRWT